MFESWVKRNYQDELDNSSRAERRVLWWKPNLDDESLHKMADLEIARQLALKNYCVYMIVPTKKEKMSITSSQVKIVSLRMKSLPLILPLARSILLSFLLPFYVLTFRAKYVICEPDVSIISFIPLVILSKFERIKIILDIRTVPVETFGFLGFMMNVWFTFSVCLAKKCFDGMTIITPQMREELCTRFKMDPAKIGIWTSGVQTELFDPEKEISKAQEFKENLGLTSNFVVFYHGIFGPTRGLTQCVEAIKRIKDSHPNIILFLLGNGTITCTLKKIIQDKNLEHNVIIHRSVDQKDVPKFISMCDVAIIPLPDNQFWRSQSPLKLLEYLAMKKVVILTKISAHESIIGRARCGIYISSIDPSEIASAIKYAYSNRLYLKDWGEDGRALVTKGFTWKKVAEELENYLGTLT